MTKVVELHPRYFGASIQETLLRKLEEEVEGSCDGKYGYIISVINLINDQSSKGVLQPGTGLAVFNVKFRSIIFRPFRGEVLEGVVSQVANMGFFVEIGPLTVLVSSHQIPSKFKFDPSTNSFAHEEGTISISKDDEVRLKIIGSRIDATEIFSLGSILDDYLGLV